ncbi:hypothetical protein TGCAST_254835B [Toxoplasma gondii CAST]|uniref:Uncharacterized protein n=1 Tax=Toxoplasma gondii CAST TaxID=943122 RepID=A0A3R7Z2W5_TOXGO|nr:hypothetical protein TGCAST_254835B [Toxoplasma gondii CAST]
MPNLRWRRFSEASYARLHPWGWQGSENCGGSLPSHTCELEVHVDRPTHGRRRERSCILRRIRRGSDSLFPIPVAKLRSSSALDTVCSRCPHQLLSRPLAFFSAGPVTSEEFQ